MALNLRTSARTGMIQAIITDAGNGAQLRFYNGTRPAGLGAVTGANTLLGTMTQGASSPLGTAGSGSLDWDEAGFTQNNALHVTGVPTFVDILTSAGAIVGRVDIGAGAGNWQFTGTIQTNQNITLNSLLFTSGNA
jgi:hypothetical protein